MSDFDFAERIDRSTIVSADQIKGEDEEETGLLRDMFGSAKTFLLSFTWCAGIREEYYGFGVGGVVAVFLFRIVRARPGVDEWLWVVVGDIPSAYLVTDDAPNPACALAGYIREMLRWVHAVRRGRPTGHLIRVNVTPTNEYADLLDSRLKFLCENILRVEHAAELGACARGRRILRLK